MELRKTRINKKIPGYELGKDQTYRPYVQGAPAGYTPFWNNQNFLKSAGVPSVFDVQKPSLSGYQPDFNTFAQQPSLGQRFGNNAASIAQSGIAFGQSLGNSFSGVKGVNQIMNETGTTYSNGVGFGYQRVNNVDVGAHMTQLRKENQANTLKTVGTGAAAGAAVGSVFGPVGGLIGGAVGAIGGLVGGLFGAGHRKRKMLRRLNQAKIEAQNQNNYNQSSAQTDYMTQSYYNENGDTRDDVLYAKRGKDAGVLKQPINTKHSVYTSAGKVSAKPNARVAAGESIIDNLNDVSNTTGHVVKTGKPGQDTNLANLNNGTVVLGQDLDWRTGTTFRDQSLPYTQALEKINKQYETRTNSKINELRGSIGETSDKIQQQEINKIKQPIVEKLKDLAEQQAYQHKVQDMNNNLQQYPGYKRGKSTYNNYGYIEPISWYSNAIPMGIGAITSVGQYMSAKNQDINTPDVYAGNPYERAALQQLASVRVNPYEAINAVYKQSGRNRYSINRAGGLSGSQKYLANVAAGLGTQEQLADVIQKSQEVNNQYRSKWAEAALNAGNALASRRQQANQYNTEYAANAHASRQQGMQMGLRNFMDYIQQYAANEYKRKTGNGMLGLYQQKIAMDKNALGINQAPNQVSVTTPSPVIKNTTPVQSYTAPIAAQPITPVYTGPVVNAPAYQSKYTPINFTNYTPQYPVWNNMFR